MYHGVETEPLAPGCWHVLDVGALRRQLEYVRRRFTVLPLEEALERMYVGTLPGNAAALTFDDGTRNLLTHAAPVLRELGLPAAVFLATGPMGTDETLWPDQLWLAFARTDRNEIDCGSEGIGVLSLRNDGERAAAYATTVEHLKDLPDDERLSLLRCLLAMLAPGAEATDPGPFQMLSWDEARVLTGNSRVSLHPHTVTHPILSRCPDDKVDDEISESCAALERELSCGVNVFAYPNGRAQDFDERAKAVLRRRGIRWALATTRGLAHAKSDPLALPRIPIGGDLSFAGFRLLVSGAFPATRERADRKLDSAAGAGRP